MFGCWSPYAVVAVISDFSEGYIFDGESLY